LRARPHLIVARVASDADSVGADALLAQTLGVLVVYRADALDGAIGVAEERASQESATSGGFGRVALITPTGTPTAVARSVSAGQMSSLLKTSASGRSAATIAAA